MYRSLLIFLTLFAVSCGGEVGSKSTQTPRPVKSVIATTSEFVERDFAALSTPAMAVNLAFKISGQLLVIPVVKGQEVAKGELLARIDPIDVELQLSADRSTFEQSRSQYERMQRLLAHEAISRQEVEAAESNYSRAESAYKNSEEMLQQTTLRSPFRAIVERVYVDTYQRVSSGETVMRIVTPTTRNVEFTLPESYLSAIANPKTTFRVRFDLLPFESFEAKVTEYARTSSDASGFPVTLQISGNDESKYQISSGMSCTVTMSILESDSGAVVLPLSAIFAPASGGTFVWVVTPANRVERRSVEIERLTGQRSVVLSRGVTSGERIVTAGVYQLSENQPVKLLD